MTQQLSLFPDLVAGPPARDKPLSSQVNLRQAVEAYLPTVTDLPPAERPRARLEAYGSGSLATAELLAVLLGTPHQITDAEKLRLVEVSPDAHGNPVDDQLDPPQTPAPGSSLTRFAFSCGASTTCSAMACAIIASADIACSPTCNPERKPATSPATTAGRPPRPRHAT